MTIYLIDFENVSIGGLKGASELGQNDLVFLFSSKNAARLTTATLATFNSTTLKFVEVPVKKQSLDMHLVSYLGYLIGTTDAEHFIIISNDHDYDNIMAFWRANGRNVTVERRGSIAVNPAQDNKPSENRRRRRSSSNTQAAPAVQTEAEKAIAGDTAAEEKKPENKKRGRSVSAVNTDQKAAGAVSEDAKNDKAAAIREELSKVYDEAVCEDVLRIISSHSDERNPLTSIHNDLRDTYQDPDYLDIYKIIKPILSPAPGRRSRHNTKTANTSQKPAADKAPNSSVTRINNEVQKILSKAKYETEIISHVAGLAAKSHGVKNGKMAVYRGIISKYGREKGLEIYDKLKALLSDPGLWE